MNLVYFGARYYDWLRGQWISVEPMAEKYPSLGPYVYVANNPVNAIDRDGKDIINKTKRPVAIIGDDYVGYNKTVMRYKVLGENQNSNVNYDGKGNLTWDNTDYDFFNLDGVWYKTSASKVLNYWITDKWGAKHPFNFLVREATLLELNAIREWLKLAGAPEEAIEEIKTIIEKAEREQKKENQGQSKESKSEEEKKKEREKNKDKNENETDPNAGWGAQHQKPPR